MAAPAEDEDDATVRSMEAGDHDVALGYPLVVVGDGGRAPAPYQPPHLIEELVNCCSSCRKFLLGFILTIVFLLLTEIILSMVLQSAPSPLTLLIFLPVVALGFTVGVVGCMAISVLC